MSWELVQYVIYEHPKDYPDGFVVRQWRIHEGEIQGAVVAQYAPTLEKARELVPEGFVNIGRFSNDDPAICEVWT